MSSTPLTASIITIGDELLIGQTIDTNSGWMAKELNAIGVEVVNRVAVGDNRQAIWKALDDAIERASVVLITGGLGPTADDITKPLLCDYFGGKMVVNAEVLAHVQYIFNEIVKRPLLDRNLKQAEVPDNCKVLLNKRGTAPGMWFEKSDPVSGSHKIIVSMPGVPHEMKGLMQESVLPALKNLNPQFVIHHRTLLTAGMGESMIAERLESWEAQLPEPIKLAYLPNYGMVRLRLTVMGRLDMTLEKIIDEKFAELQDQLKDIAVINEDIPLEQALGMLLKEKNKTIATAESCSGGYIAHLITSIPGSSVYYKGSVVAYDYTIKEKLLGVQNSTLQTYGAVSRETVTEMLQGLLKSTEADYGIAVSGIMGPGGGTDEKPVGTVWVAVGSLHRQKTRSYLFRFDRQRNIFLTAAYTLLDIWKFIREDE